MENQQTLLLKLLNDFELCLERIKDIFSKEQAENTHENNDDEWIDLDEDEEILEKKQIQLKSCILEEIDQVESQNKVSNTIIRILVVLREDISITDLSMKNISAKNVS